MLELRIEPRWGSYITAVLALPRLLSGRLSFTSVSHDIQKSIACTVNLRQANIVCCSEKMLAYLYLCIMCIILSYALMDDKYGR